MAVATAAIIVAVPPSGQPVATQARSQASTATTTESPVRPTSSASTWKLVTGAAASRGAGARRPARGSSARARDQVSTSSPSRASSPSRSREDQSPPAAAARSAACSRPSRAGAAARAAPRRAGSAVAASQAAASCSSGASAAPLLQEAAAGSSRRKACARSATAEIIAGTVRAGP